MNVLIMMDQEGVAGYVSFDYDPNSRNNEQGKHLLTGEVNAAIDGLVEAGTSPMWRLRTARPYVFAGRTSGISSTGKGWKHYKTGRKWDS